MTTNLLDRAREAYEAGWRNAADWASRDDLHCDVDSPAYIKQRDIAIADLDRARSEPQTVTDDQIATVAHNCGWAVEYMDFDGDNETTEPHIWDTEGNDCFPDICKIVRAFAPHACPECKKRDAAAKRYLFIRDGMRDPGYSIWYDGKRLTLLELEGLDAHIDAAIAAARDGAK